ncbi:CFDP2 [Symbiodinium necroappetens]|uniref:CFDP2 protein n=1 Tax=Symbiodinium necroappetens TaxID=1628268 RepID=A0A813CJM6_9DINO|nr:CFDP2 [Symbiodinium necroappetens]
MGHAQQVDQVLLPDWPAKVFEHPQREWIWLTGVACQDLPTLFAFESEAIRLQSSPRLPSEDPVLGFVPEPQTSTLVPLQFALMSYNVLTLYDPKRAGQPQLGVGMRVRAKRDIIKRQLQDFLMLQASAEENGHHGVALWVSKRPPYASVRGKDLVFRKEHCCVVGFSSRHLVVQFTAPLISWTVLVAHAPSEPPAPPGTSKAFWAQCKKDLERRPKGSDIIVLTDANAWLGSLVSPSVSDLDLEPENLSGEQFHHFLAEMDLWVPSTFRSCHSGPSGTWTAPTGHEHRLDYVAVPLGWPSDAVASSVLVDFESLQVGQDHKPVLMRVGLIAKTGATKSKGAYKRQALRPTADAYSPAYLAALAMMPSSPGLACDTCVDRHYVTLVESWNRAGQVLQAQAAAKPQQEYIQPHTMSIVHARRGLREFLSLENGELRRRRLLLGFAAFLHLRGHTSFPAAAVTRYSEWFSYSHRRIASALRMVRLVGFHLRQAVRADRAAYLDGLVRNITLSDIKDPKHLFSVLAPDVASQPELWRAHFASLEAGEKLEPGQYAAAFRNQRSANLERKPRFDFRIVPSLTTVEQSILSLKRGKACGQDGLTAELLRNSTALSARALLPVFVKSILGAQEPVEYRGGALMPLAKKASSAFSCAKFRAILLSCVPSKMLHKHVRTCLSAHLSPSALQAGVLPGVSTESIALAARAFQSFCHCNAQPWALLFFDVRSAFYRVIRQLLLPVGDSDSALLSLFSRLRLPPAFIEELRDHLARLATVSQTSCSDNLRKVATDVLQGTWFRLDQDTALTLTHCGTRPGDGLADMFFGFAFSAYLKAADQALQERGLDTRMPEPKHAEPWPLESLPPTIGAGSWADDFVHLHAQGQPSGLGRAIQQIVPVYVTQAEAIGMELTFAVDKTAAMVAPKDRVRDDDWTGITDADGPFLWVRTLTPAPEIGLRYSLAANMVRFGSAIHFRNWAKHYVALWRALHPWLATNKQPHAYQVLRTAEAPSPPLALALARSVLLRQIVAKGPSTLVRLLWVQWEQDSAGSWFGALVQDVRHAAQYVPAARLLLSTTCPLRALLEAVRDDGMWWTRQLKKAAKVFQSDLDTWAQVGHSPATNEQDEAAPSPPPDLCFRCTLCPAAFPLRKHLAVHEARKHGLISVTRLLSPGPTCLACMRHYDSTERAQYHLKSSHTCLHRVARLIPPLSVDEVKDAERDCKRLKRQVVHGKWELYKAPEQVQVAAGPKLLTAHERVAAEGEEISLRTLAGLFHPCPDFLRRVDAYIADRSQEGPRRTSASFWDRRPR